MTPESPSPSVTQRVGPEPPPRLSNLPPDQSTAISNAVRFCMPGLNGLWLGAAARQIEEFVAGMKGRAWVVGVGEEGSIVRAIVLMDGPIGGSPDPYGHVRLTVVRIPPGEHVEVSSYFQSQFRGRFQILPL